jgi:hypothetical protein
MTADADYSAYTDVPPLNVHVVGGLPPLTIPDKMKKECRVAHRTFVLTAANPYMNILPYDPLRKEIHVETIDNPVIISTSVSQASDLNNQAAGLAAPNGRILATNVGEYVIPGPNETWLTAATFPSRVGVTIVREI